MALSVNQTFKNYYTMRLGTLSTQHQIQSNRIMLYTNEVTDIAQRINFFESQKVLTLATPSGDRLALNAKYFDLPRGFMANDPDTWGSDGPKYTTPCQKQIFIYNKIDDVEAARYTSSNANDYYYIGNLETFNGQNYGKIPYTDTDLDGTYDNPDISDSRILSNKLMMGEFTFVYRNDSGVNQKLSYKDLTFVTEQEDKTAYQEQVQVLEAQKEDINATQKRVQQEMSVTETQIQAIQSMMDSTDKVLQKNTETFKWGA